MKTLIVLLFFFPLLSFADLISDQRVRSQNEGDNLVFAVDATDDSEEATVADSQVDANVNDDEAEDPLAEDLAATGGYQQSDVGGLDNSNSAKSQGNMTAIIGAVQGIGFARICHSGGFWGGGSWACPLAAMSFADALAASRASSDAGYTGSFLDPNTGFPEYDPGEFGNDTYADQSIAGLEELKDLGYTLNEDGSVNTPSAGTINSANAATVDSLVKQGLTQDQAEKALGKISQIQNNAKKTASATASGDLDSAGSAKKNVKTASLVSKKSEADQNSSEGASGISVFPKAIELRRGKKNKKNRLPASKAAEYSKNFNGTPIGIGLADIFLIVHKKYSDEKSKKTKFINKEY